MLYSFHSGNFSDSLTLSEEESHHLVSVRRARNGEAVIVLDGRGRSGRGAVVRADPKRAVVEIRSVETLERDTPPIFLAQAMPLGKTMDTIVQKAAELGAAGVVPLITERSELRLDGERTEKKLARWRAAAVEAVKQCGNPFLPEISEPVTLAAFAAGKLPSTRLVCSLEGRPQSLTDALSRRGAFGGVVLAIGPEGDFSPAEYAALRQAGFSSVTLGPLVLRSETAALASLAIVSEILRHLPDSSSREVSEDPVKIV